MTGPHDVATFDPLLRDLVRWGLVQPAPSGDATWELTADAQRRLTRLASRTVPPAEHLVYLGRHCGVCGGRGLTRLRGEGYVCDRCSEGVSERPPAGRGPRNDPVAERQVRARHLRRREGASRLAS